MNNTVRFAGLLVVLSLLTTAALDAPYAAPRRSLRSRKAAADRGAAAARAKIHTLKKRAVAQRGQLSAAQQALQEAQGDLRQATAQLRHTQAALAVVRREHQEASERHLTQKKRMEARVLAQSEAGNPSYLEVVLNATDFADFTDRAQMTQVIVERDQGLLQQLLATRRALARQKAALQEKRRQEAAQRDEVARQRNEVAIKTEIALDKLKDTNAARARAERELAAFEQASSEIAAMLSRVQHSGASGGAYSGSWGGSFLRPVPGYISSAFGWRIHPITHTRRFHDGVDLACGGGTPIRAADKGRVIHAGWWGAYGIAVVIDHGSGMSTLYGHCMRGSLRVSSGDVVSRGQVVASVDSTGWSTGDHLHFSVRRYGSPVAPF
ncbi:peptidoglycan DD-metalloendopeptidase family protein [bacterium]|nr:peptidoglycan DD-metalloendopeptidase family protein [bacterium]